MEFKYFNSNPDASVFKSGKPKGWNRDDSSIRSICAATGLSWDEVFTKLSEIALKYHDMPSSKNVINEFCVLNNFEYNTYGKPAPGTTRPTIEQFANTNTKGTYILYLRNYFICIKDGCQLNTVEMQNDSVYSYWKLKQ